MPYQIDAELPISVRCLNQIFSLVTVVPPQSVKALHLVQQAAATRRADIASASTE